MYYYLFTLFFLVQTTIELLFCDEIFDFFVFVGIRVGDILLSDVMICLEKCI